MTSKTCLVTVHGIGFQQPPDDKRSVPGYADGLHDHLRIALGERLGEDPERPAGGAVYVASECDGAREKGLARLDKEVLTAGDGDVAHVALVYSPSEPLDARLGSVLDASARAAFSFGQYTNVLGALRLLGGDAWAAIHGGPGADDGETTLRPRTDLPVEHHHGRIAAAVRSMHRHGGDAAAGDPPPTSFGILQALADDVAAYVCRNDLRERVRGFVDEALYRLAHREDVACIVVNAHSQGTVLCWDVLCRTPIFDARHVAEHGTTLGALVTAGSPIRKYVDMFAWGERVGRMAALETPFAWRNFWDEHDPVADPLNPPANWKPGRPTDGPFAPDPGHPHGLLVAIDPKTGEPRHFDVEDEPVDNIANSTGGGLRAHDYWNNETEFVAPLADLVRGVAPVPA